MKLTAFRIKNFRSIKDTGWCNLSTDSITGLIGQNESGKSSILEALYSFYTGKLNNDYLRSNGDYPEVCCCFELSDGELSGVISEFIAPKDLVPWINGNGNRVNLTSNWTDLKQARTITLERQEVIEIFNKAAEAANLPVLVPATEAVKEIATAAAATVSAAVPNPTAASQASQAPVPPPDPPKPKQLTAEIFADKLFGAIPTFELFVDDRSLLPKSINLADITAEKAVKGIEGAKNFLTITGLQTSELSAGDNRIIDSKIRVANKQLTKDFQSFWSQYVGKSNKLEIEVVLKHHDDSEGQLAGTPYLVFWVKDGDELLYPEQRSKGVRWFLSFFLQLKASSMLHKDGRILLIDEPGAALHAKAQEDVLKVFEDIKKQLQIVYTTHSPYLIEAKTLYRLLAVQRADEDDTNSETRVFDIHKLGAASRDTLLPVYTLIGVDIQHQRVITAANNVLTEEPSAFYYLMAFKKLVGETHEISFVPATGVTNIPLLVNLFLGWGLSFVVLTDDDDAGKRVRRGLKADVYGNSGTEAKKHLLAVDGCHGIEDVFSKGDFKEYVLKNKSLPYTEDNSAYMLTSGASKVVSAISFYHSVENGSITLAKLTTKTQDGIKTLISNIVTHLDALT